MTNFVGQDVYIPNTYINSDTVLSEGAVGYERATGKYKVGNGVTPWNLLDYIEGEVVNGVLLTAGGIEFNINLASLEGIELTNVNDNDILVYDSATGLWKNQSVSLTGQASELHIDGGRADSIYIATQRISGGNANG